jgi:hypothetical protein
MSKYSNNLDFNDLSIGFAAQRVPQGEPEKLVLLEYLSSPPVLVGLVLQDL